MSTEEKQNFPTYQDSDSIEYPQNEKEVSSFIKKFYKSGVPIELIGSGSKRKIGKPLQCAKTLSLINLNGIIVNVPVRLFNNNGYDQTEYFQVPIGNIQQTDPMGPDNYGYFIFGNEDLEYQDEAEYNWIEIDPDYGGQGNLIGISDGGDKGDDVDTIDYNEDIQTIMGYDVFKYQDVYLTTEDLNG